MLALMAAGAALLLSSPGQSQVIPGGGANCQDAGFSLCISECIDNAQAYCDAASPSNCTTSFAYSECDDWGNGPCDWDWDDEDHQIVCSYVQTP